LGAPNPSESVVRFGVFELDLRARELRKDGRTTGLPEQSIRILALLVERPGDVVLREEIRKTLWPNDTVVEFDHSINAAMKRLRQALDDSADNPQYIETLARRGYRWLVPAQRLVAGPGGEAIAGHPAVAPVEAPGPGSFAFSLIGKKVSHYRVLQIVGGGGMGVVFEAEDIKLGRRVALKFLPEELACDLKALERFEREARAASALDHPNICSIHEFGEHESQPFIVMQLLEGQTLRNRIGIDSHHSKPLPTEELLDLAIQIACGLEAAHQKGIIHRDIKPSNIFITNRGEAKILDFGVAKLTSERFQTGSERTSESIDATTPRDSTLPALSSLTLTGGHIGTASYMSPEQIRGEKVDARSDLFSFGLVLHEMATGHHAFAAQSTDIVRAAILDRPVKPTRELNPELPAGVDSIIHQALEKNRLTRYQSATEIRTDLEALRENVGPKNRLHRLPLTAGVTVLALLVGALFWFTRQQHLLSQSPPALKLTQLTNTSAENHVTSGSISPDGKTLAFTDMKNIYVKHLDTGEVQRISQPAEMKNIDAQWEIVTSWFPDSKRFLASAHPEAEASNDWSSFGTSMWLFSVLGEAPRKLRDDAYANSISPDGTIISFGTNPGKVGDREIWFMDANGDHLHKFLGVGEDEAIGALFWLSPGQRVAYKRTDSSGDSLISQDISGAQPTTLLTPEESKDISEFTWLPGGRLLYSVSESPGFGGNTCNFWVKRIDLRTGRPLETATQLSHWNGFCMNNVSVTEDGKRVAFIEQRDHPTVNVAELKAGGRSILRQRHFTLSDSSDMPSDWTQDSKAMLFHSDRGGQPALYQQALNEDLAKRVASLPQRFTYARLTPGGNALVYLLGDPDGPRLPEPVMLAPLDGSPEKQLFTAKFYSALNCARYPAKLCIVGEPTDDFSLLIISELDLAGGRGRELARLPLNPKARDWQLELSPDGTRIAFLPSPTGSIQVLSLQGKPSSAIPVKGYANIQTLNWDSSSRGFYISEFKGGNTSVLHVDLNGDSNVLWEHPGVWGNGSRPSLDGRYLALTDWEVTGNMWLMENF
jgi:eukaryotic-like serine/threonine-protein kinase